MGARERRRAAIPHPTSSAPARANGVRLLRTPIRAWSRRGTRTGEGLRGTQAARNPSLLLRAGVPSKRGPRECPPHPFAPMRVQRGGAEPEGDMRTGAEGKQCPSRIACEHDPVSSRVQDPCPPHLSCATRAPSRMWDGMRRVACKRRGEQGSCMRDDVRGRAHTLPSVV